MMKIGEILIQQNSITREQLELALWVQKIWGGLIGRILCSRGYVSEPELTAALSLQWGIPAVSLHDRSIPDLACRLFPLEFCISHLVLPFSQDPDSGAVALAMTNPRDAALRTLLQAHLRVPFTAYVCGYNDITESLYRLATRRLVPASNEEAETVTADAIMEETDIAAIPDTRTSESSAVEEGELLEESEMAAALFKTPSPAGELNPAESGGFEILSADDLEEKSAAPEKEHEEVRQEPASGTAFPEKSPPATQGSAESPKPDVQEKPSAEEPTRTQGESGRKDGPPPSPFTRVRPR